MPTIPLPIETGRTLIYDGLAQNDVDMANYRLLNLDTSNLPPIGIPPSIIPPAHQWLREWNAITHTWTATQPNFTDIAGLLTLAQQSGITQVGTIRIGTWQATEIGPNYVPTLDLIRSPRGNVSLNQKRIINLAPPVDPTDAVNKAFMDLLLQGLNPKEAVRVASPGSGRPWPGPGGLGTIDGVDIEDGDRVLLYHFTSGREYHEGIWIAHEITWERAPDTLGTGGLDRAYVTVLEGVTNGGKSFVQTATLAHNPPLLGDDPNWILFSTSSAAILAGNGLVKTGNTLNVVGTATRISVGPDNVDIDPGYVGQTSITTLGIVTAGTWHGAVVDGSHGGTGVANIGRLITLIGNFSTGISSLSDAPGAVPGSPLTFGLLGPTTINLPQTGTMVTEDAEETLTNKRIMKRAISLLASSKPVINTDDTDVYMLSAQDRPITSFTDNLTGSPTNGQDLYIYIEEVHELPPPPAPAVPIVQNFPLTWGSAFRDSAAIPLPNVTVGDGGLFLWFVFSESHGKWILAQKVEEINL